MYRRLHQLAPIWTSRFRGDLQKDSHSSQPWRIEHVSPNSGIRQNTVGEMPQDRGQVNKRDEGKLFEEGEVDEKCGRTSFPI
jgi:hypothetical protein